MSFFKKIKDKLGIGGVSVNLDIPGQVSKDSGVIDGKFTLTTKSEQEVLSFKVTLSEEYTKGRGDDEKTKTFELGTTGGKDIFIIKPGETKEIPFSLPFTMIKSDSESLAEEGGALGKLGKLASIATNESSSYSVEVEVDVKSAALDPDDKKDIKLV